MGTTVQRRASRARVRKKVEVPVQADQEEEETSPDNLEVEIEPIETETLPFLERMTARIKDAVAPAPGAAKKPSTRRGKKTEMISQSLPVLTAILANIVRSRVEDRYKACAPEPIELTAILQPLVSMLERRIQITGKVSQDALDIMTCVLAIIGYGARVYITKEAIDAQGQQQQPPAATGQEQSDSPLPGNFGRGENQSQISGSARDSALVSPGDNQGAEKSDTDGGSVGNPATSDSGVQGGERQLVANAFKRDALYRAQAGLL